MNNATTAIRRHETSVANPARAWSDALAVIGLAVLATAFPIVTHLWSPVVAIAACAVTTALIANYLPAALPAVLVFSYLFQNSIVSLVSPWIADVADFGPIRGYSFFATAVAWLVASAYYWGNANRFPARFRTLMLVSTIAIGLTGVYFAYGVATSGSTAIIYLRNIAGPLFLFQAFAITAQRCEVRFDGPMLIIAILLLAAGYTELLFRDQWLALLNGESYWALNSAGLRSSGALLKELRETGRVFLELKDLFRTELFNSSYLSGLNIAILRLNGPNYHPISFGYALAFMVLYMTTRRGWPFILLAVPLLIFASAKGSIILILATMLGLAASRIWTGPGLLIGFAALLAGYTLFGITSGLSVGDYHVVGFFGGVNGFLGNPLGHGLGAGGNLTTDFSTLDWSKAQALGESSAAVESAIGVLLFQTGIATAALVGTYLYIAASAWTAYREQGVRAGAMLTFALAVILVNGVFQEEALFAPLALALLLGLAGIVIGTAARETPSFQTR